MEYNSSTLLRKNITMKEYKESNKHFVDTKLREIEREQIKSKRRVSDHGEVLTPTWLANNMLDLLPKSTESITTRYLEPAAGEGVFLVEILKRKLDIIFGIYKKRKDIEFYTLVATSNIYGLELLKDNVEIIRNNLMFVIKIYFKERFEIPFGKKFASVVKKIIDLNIIHMDSMEYRTPVLDRRNKLVVDINGKMLYEDELTKISEWKFNEKKKSMRQIEYYYKDIIEIQRQKYMLSNNMRSEELTFEEEEIGQINLFNKIDSNEEKKDSIKEAVPIKIMSDINYLELAEVE